MMELLGYWFWTFNQLLNKKTLLMSQRCFLFHLPKKKHVFCFTSMRQWQIMLLGVYVLGVGNFLSCTHQNLIRSSETLFHLAESGWGRVVKFIDCYTLYLKFLSPWSFTWIMWFVQLIPFKLHALLLLMDLSLLISISFNTDF